MQVQKISFYFYLMRYLYTLWTWNLFLISFLSIGGSSLFPLVDLDSNFTITSQHPSSSYLHNRTAVRDGAGTPQVPWTAVRDGADIDLPSLFNSVSPRDYHSRLSACTHVPIEMVTLCFMFGLKTDEDIGKDKVFARIGNQIKDPGFKAQHAIH